MMNEEIDDLSGEGENGFAEEEASDNSQRDDSAIEGSLLEPVEIDEEGILERPRETENPEASNSSAEEEADSSFPNDDIFANQPEPNVEEDDTDDDTDTDDSSDRDFVSTLTVGSSKPVKGEAFCDCYKTGKEKECVCGEDDSYFEWLWDNTSKSAASFLKHDQREVVFHVDYSCGTAAVRGSQPMSEDQYYWEVKMTTPVYGTDMMVGVGASDLDLNRYRHKFCSLIGRDSDSWGLSYTGLLHHRGCKQVYSSKYGQGTIIGVHLDMWHGTLTFYKNRRSLGIAYRGLQGKKLVPIVSSTAARSGMKVIKCRSFKTSLQFMCCQKLRTIIPRHLDVLKVIDLPPGLRGFLENNIDWLLKPSPLETPVDGQPGTSGMSSRPGTKRKHSSTDDSDEEDSSFRNKSPRKESGYNRYGDWA